MSAGSPAGKRKRPNDEEGQGDNHPAAATSTDAGPSPSQLASNLRSGSLDGLRQTLTSIRQATAVDLDEDARLIGPNDRRLVFARELLQDRGVASLFDAWSRVHDSAVPTLQPLPVFVLGNLISLLSCHLTDHPLCLELINPVLPPTNAADEAASYWQKLHSYLLNFAPQSRSNGPSNIQGRSSEVLVLATLQSLMAVVRFESGRFARSVVEHIAWNAKSVARLASMRKKPGKDKANKTSTTSFSRPDIRLSFAMFIMTLLHPSPLPDLENDESSTAVDSGASTSTKLLLLNESYGFSHLVSLVKSVSDDSVTVALRLLHTFERALLRDTRLPRGSLISLVRNADLLLLLLRAGQKSDALEDLTMRMLAELCTKPGRGICFVDNGWYGRGTGSNSTADTSAHLNSSEFDESLVHNESGPSAPSTSSAAAAGIFNPLLSAFIQHYEFSPLFNTAHRSLLFAILDAAKELQPIYMSSTRGVFGAGRLDPPLPPVAAGGTIKSSTVEGGARLSGLLANRLLGQLLDLDLPEFRPQRLPSSSKLVAGVLPAVITRANLAKGIRHHDRLVRWSFLDLLQRLLERLLRFEQTVEMISLHEQGWTALEGTVFKEASRRLPDAASILGFLEESQQSSSDQPDHLLVEASLHSVALLLQYQRCRNSGDGQLSYDCRRLLSLPYMQLKKATPGDTMMTEAGEDDGDDSRAFEPLIQRHILRILRLARVPILGSSTSNDKSGTSTFARLIGIALSVQGSTDLSQEAMHLLTASLGSAYGADNDSTTASSLLFEGDAGEFEAWCAALCPASDSVAHDAVVSLLEECLNRATRNSYRYLELARELVVDDGPQAADEALPLSPLFMCFIEQVQIKLDKALFASEEVTRAVLCFLCKLCPLLVGRGRIGVEAALLQAVDKLAQTATGGVNKITKDSQQLLGRLVTVCSLLAGQSRASTTPSAGK